MRLNVGGGLRRGRPRGGSAAGWAQGGSKGDSAGFSLLEAVIASGLLLLTVTAVTLCVSAVSGSARRTESAQRAESALRALSAWLSSLPYCPAELPAPGAARGPDAGDLVAAVFPHACPWDDRPDARYVSADEGGIAGGSFVSRFTVQGEEVVCVARFLGADGLALASSDIEGFHVALSRAVPGSTLEVVLSAPAAGGRRESILVRTAGAGARLEPEEAAG